MNVFPHPQELAILEVVVDVIMDTSHNILYKELGTISHNTYTLPYIA